MGIPRRLLFGEVADQYDRHRPGYPPQLIDDLVALAGLPQAGRALEVGAGTGKATALFAQRSVRVLAVEPSAAMAAVARHALADRPQVTIVESDFERFDAGGETFPLVYSAQAWHWVDPAVRFQRARAVLAPGGWLAAFWNRPAWPESPLRAEMRDAYARIVPDIPADGPLHPANPQPTGIDDWSEEITGLPGLADPEEREYRWTTSYSAAQFAGLLGTLSEIRLLDPDRRRRLLRTAEEIVERHGGTLPMPMLTRLELARAV